MNFKMLDMGHSDAHFPGHSGDVVIFASAIYRPAYFELVATQTDASRPAIYRRWKKKEDLIAEALNSERLHPVAPILEPFAAICGRQPHYCRIASYRG
jgi:hypothetical protein